MSQGLLGPLSAEERRLVELLQLGADGSGPRAQEMARRSALENSGGLGDSREDEVASVEAAEARLQRLRDLDTPRREAREAASELALETEARQDADRYMAELMNEISEEVGCLRTDRCTVPADLASANRLRKKW